MVLLGWAFLGLADLGLNEIVGFSLSAYKLRRRRISYKPYWIWNVKDFKVFVTIRPPLAEFLLFSACIFLTKLQWVLELYKNVMSFGTVILINVSIPG